MVRPRRTGPVPSLSVRRVACGAREIAGVDKPAVGAGAGTHGMSAGGSSRELFAGWSGHREPVNIPAASTLVTAFLAVLGRAILGTVRVALEVTVASDDHRKQHCRKLTTSHGMARNRRANQLAAAKV
jgi:hypothetical protein